MGKKSALDIIARFRQGIEARGIRLQKVILYGSYATGTNREESDIDVVVISDDFIGKGYWERIDILTEVIYEIFAPVEAVFEWRNRFLLEIHLLILADTPHNNLPPQPIQLWQKDGMRSSFAEAFPDFFKYLISRNSLNFTFSHLRNPFFGFSRP